MTWMSDVCRALARTALFALIVSLAAGCDWSSWLMRPTFMRPAPPAVLSEAASKYEIVEHLNLSRAPLHSWRSTDIRFYVPGPAGVPMRLTASLAAEQPRNLRLIANSLRGNEADLGSNDERFWFWVREEKSKRVYTASHTDAPLVFQQMHIPFQPEWMMQALGLGVLDPNEFELRHTQPGTGIVQLVANRIMPDGARVEHQLTVDLNRGQIIEQALYNEGGRLVARAVLKNYRNHSGIELPHHVELQSPGSGQNMTMSIGELEVNPQASMASMWELPELQGTVVFDIGQAMRMRQNAPRGGEPVFEGMNGQGNSLRLERPVMHQTSELPDEPVFANEAEPSFSEPVFAE